MRMVRVVFRVVGRAGLAVGIMSGALAGLTALATQSAAPAAAAGVQPTPVTSTCTLGNGVQHVIEILFDNVHFNRDDPNILSDLEQIPSLYNFIVGNGTLLSNSHTPLIAHTSVDSLTNYTGLYGDRMGMGIGNEYEYYRSDGSGDVNEADSFVSWNSPIINDSGQAASTEDHNPSMVNSATVPPTATTSAATGVDTVTPAPWTPFTRAGCDVGAVATANMTLEKTADINTVYGAGSPEAAELAADDSFGDATTADYLGLTVHCAEGDGFCSTATGVKFGQSTASPTANSDLLPDEPGGYTGFQELNGHRYIAPQLGQGIDNLTNANGYPVTNAAGNLVDLEGNQLNGDFESTPGFPGFGPIVANQSLAYVADMQESGVPVTYAYIGDVHEKKFGDTGCTNPYTGTGGAAGPGDPCYVENTKAYDQAFSQFFARLAADGINKSNTLFEFGSDEGDHFAGANVGRTITPNCSGTTNGAPQGGLVSNANGTPAASQNAPLQIPDCSYANTGSGATTVNYIGEDEVSSHGLLAAQEGNTTPYYIEGQGPVVFAEGNQTTSTVRQLERDFGLATVNNPYEANAADPLIRYLADPTAEQLLHFVDADPTRTPSFAAFPDPDVYFSAPSTPESLTGNNSNDSPACAAGTTAANANTGCAQIASHYAWDHGYYSPEVNTNWWGIVGPGVKNNGIDGPGPANAAITADQAETGVTTVPLSTGTWADQTDVRPTLLALAGLKDDKIDDGRVVYEDLTIMPNGTATAGNASTAQVESLAECYKQLNASVGQFGDDVLVGDNAALRTGTAGDDSVYQSYLSQLQTLGAQRDTDATTIKADLAAAEFGTGLAASEQSSDLTACQSDLSEADMLAASVTPSPSVPESPLSATLPAIVGALILGGYVVFHRRYKTAAARRAVR